MSLPKAMAANKFPIAALACVSMLIIGYIHAVAGSHDIDRLGVSEIYQTKPGGREWFFNATEPRDGLTISPAATTLHADPGGAWKIGRETGSANTGLRMYVISSDGWQDVEMTGYVRLESYTFDEEFAWAVRSGQHTDSNPCDGTAYYGALSFAGQAWFQKEVTHTEGGYTDRRHSSLTVDPLKNRWVGIKMIAYNIDQGVKLELWVDDRADNSWAKIAETTDAGGWSSKIESCGREPDYVISEARPRVVFRVDNATFEIRDLSVREIVSELPQPKCYYGAFTFCFWVALTSSYLYCSWSSES